MEILKPGCAVIKEYTDLPGGDYPYVENHGLPEEETGVTLRRLFLNRVSRFVNCRATLIRLYLHQDGDGGVMGRAIMLQGTGSSVGKSTIVAALCRIFSQEGYRVAPFKSQNMGTGTVRLRGNQEISRVQYRQTLAAQVEPAVEMNPVLLKPVSDLDSEVIVNGRSVGVMSAQEYIAFTSPGYCKVSKMH